MPSLFSTLRRSDPSLEDYAGLVSEYGLAQGFGALTQTMQGDTAEPAGTGFVSYVAHAYKANAIVAACELTRLMLFAQVRFGFRRRNRSNDRPGDLFHTDRLALLDRPWPNGTTSDLLARMIQDADFAGNAFQTIVNGRMHRLRPDYVSIILGSDLEPDDPDTAIDSHVVGFFYDPPGRGRSRVLLPHEVAHFAPSPDPLANYRGMSWLTPVLREVRADGAMTKHQSRFFANAASPNMAIKYDASLDEPRVRRFVDLFKEQHEGLGNAYRTLHLGGGADPTVIGRDFQQMDFRATRAAGEDRIAAAAGVHPTIVGITDGLAGSSLNEGNFQASRRLVADRTLRFLWGNAASSLATLVDVPARAELWYDSRDVPFLQEDEKDAADIQFQHAQTIRHLIDSGYDPDAVIEAVTNGDMTILVGQHSGLFSVQLQEPGAGQSAEDTDTGGNGAGDPGRARAHARQLAAGRTT